MRIRLAFSNDDAVPGDMPTLIAAVDEYTEENWGKVPDFYADEIARYRNVREVNVQVDDNIVSDLFYLVPTVSASVES